VGWSCAATAKG